MELPALEWFFDLSFFLSSGISSRESDEELEEIGYEEFDLEVFLSLLAGRLRYDCCFLIFGSIFIRILRIS